MKTMASRLQNKISVDVAADRSSADSFSFAGLLCVQDQQSKSLQCNKANQIHKRGTEFEFSTTEESFVADPIKHCPADLLISNGQIVPQPIKFQSAQDTAAKKQSKKASARPTLTSSKRSTDYTSGTQASEKPNLEHTNQEKKEHAVPSSWFGRKIFKSFFFPCKESQAVKPTLRANRKPEGNGKLH